LTGISLWHTGRLEEYTETYIKAADAGYIINTKAPVCLVSALLLTAQSDNIVAETERETA